MIRTVQDAVKWLAEEVLHDGYDPDTAIKMMQKQVEDTNEYYCWNRYAIKWHCTDDAARYVIKEALYAFREELTYGRILP